MALSSSYSSSCFSIQSMCLQELDVGVVMTFHPTESELVGHYLYNKIFSALIPGKPTFPEIDIYGKTGIPPWEIYTNYNKFPHQDYVYFFTQFRKLNRGSRISRMVSSDGGTWSETEAAKAVYVDGIGEAVGKLRKFRYEKNKDKSFDHHAAWLMEEYTINQQPHLALCRIKANDRGRSNKKKRHKTSSDDDNQAGKTKCCKKRRIEKMSPQSHCEDDGQVVVVEAEKDFCDELEQMLFDNADDDENLNLAPTGGLFDDIDALTDPNLMTSASHLFGIDEEEEQQQQQFSGCSLEPQQQQLEVQQDEQQQQQQQLFLDSSLVPEQLLEVQGDEPSSAQQLQHLICGEDEDLMAYGHCDFDIPLDVAYLRSDEFNGFYIDQDSPAAPEWLQSMDYSQQALFESDLLFEAAPFPNQVL